MLGKPLENSDKLLEKHGYSVTELGEPVVNRNKTLAKHGEPLLTRSSFQLTTQIWHSFQRLFYFTYNLKQSAFVYEWTFCRVHLNICEISQMKKKTFLAFCSILQI